MVNSYVSVVSSSSGESRDLLEHVSVISTRSDNRLSLTFSRAEINESLSTSVATNCHVGSNRHASNGYTTEAPVPMSIPRISGTSDAVSLTISCIQRT